MQCSTDPLMLTSVFSKSLDFLSLERMEFPSLVLLATLIVLLVPTWHDVLTALQPS